MMMDQSLDFQPELLERFDISGPRYTSYPTADRMHSGFGARDYAQALRQRAQRPLEPVSLYFHIPFCETLCYYCGCNKIPTKNHARSAPYLDSVARELRLVAGILQTRLPVTQLHWGGGTPTFLSDDEAARLMDMTRAHFDLQPGGEFSIEIDPRKVDETRVAHLARLGFNRMSVGVQDFAPEVQQAVNRIQSVDETRRVIDAARDNGFSSISLDLIYGLPRQNLASFERTLDLVLELSPDRLSVYSYAHLPHLFKPQRRIHTEDLPSPEVKLGLLGLAIRKLEQAGYVYIGMDHFAKPQDELARAQREGKLHRNFQGYSTQANLDLLAFGVSSISNVGDCYAQNAKTIDEYTEMLAFDKLPTARGVSLTPEDHLRRAAIQRLMCDFRLDLRALAAEHGVDAATTFAADLQRLAPLEQAGLVTRSGPDGLELQVTPQGRLLVRVVAMQLDAYLHQPHRAPQQPRYSRVI
jgi:oxygen-independent coproporphyrinogen-3 oxidase